MDVFREVEEFYENYRGERRVIGKSVEGRSLFAMKMGEGKPVLLSQYAIHGREWVSALLGLEHLRRGAGRGSAWIVPLVNPDGALLSEVGLLSADKDRRARLVALNGGEDFSLWKANAAGVDLNVNFDARWGTGKSNVFSPAPANYVGERPLSEPESRALAAFTEKIAPDLTVSWHTKGEEIYWRFHQPPLRAARDRRLAMTLSRSTGYPLREAKGSAGGYKDWCVERGIPAFTVELGREDIPHPLGRETLGEIIPRCGNALIALSEAIGWRKNS